MASLDLQLSAFELGDTGSSEVGEYSLKGLRSEALWDWDRVVKGSHMANCAYQTACNLNIFVKDGVVLREEIAANYPPKDHGDAPDFNPRGCQKGLCYSQRMYDPTRLKYPLKRIGTRGEGRWQRISWDQALTEIAGVLLDVLTTEGSDAIVEAGGSQSRAESGHIAPVTFFASLGIPTGSVTADSGDEHQGAAISFGKVAFSDSADNWFYSDLILVWGGNPAYTSIPNYHFIAEARYHGTRVVVISPDYNASAIHADLWVPVQVGTDAALALSMAHIIIEEKLYKEEFIREQTDLPLLVREDTGKFLRETDLKKDGRADVFYFWDNRSKQVVEAPRRSLTLGGVVPALAGEYEVKTTTGQVRVKPVMQLLKEKLDEEYRPEKGARICGVSSDLIRRLAREVATAPGVVNASTYTWGKYYHGDLVERAIILVFALCGHVGRKGASYNAYAMIGLDSSVGGQQMRGEQVLLQAANADPRFARWRQEGYTDEMILYEYARAAVVAGAITPTSLFYMVHGGLLELSEKHNSWDSSLKRSLQAYVKDAFDKKWQLVTPRLGKEPRVMFAYAGSFLRRVRATGELIKTLLPKLRLLVAIDWRMGSTAAYADFVLPAAGWYEKYATHTMCTPIAPWVQVNDRAVDPLYESKGEWEIFCLLARKLQEKAAEQGIRSFRDHIGRERRLDNLEEQITSYGLYGEEGEEDVARDLFVNASHIKELEWEEAKKTGIAPYTSVGKGFPGIGNACEIGPAEPIVPLTWHTQKKEPYPTLTRRIQFYIDHDWYLELDEAFPTHKDNPKAGGDYPLQLTGGHARWSIHSMWADDSLLLQLQRGRPLAFMNAQDASTRGISDGDEVQVYNDVASFCLQAAVSAAVRPGQVIIYHCWENYQFPRWRHFKGVMASPMNPIELAGDYFHIRPTPMSCYPGLSDRGSRVEIKKAAL